MRRHNPHIAPGDRLITFPIYVGQTWWPIERRYLGHRGLIEGKRTVWGQRYFLPTFESAFDREIIALRGLYEAEHPGVCLDALPREEAERHEVGFGRWLRSHGSAVHFPRYESAKFIINSSPDKSGPNDSSLPTNLLRDPSLELLVLGKALLHQSYVHLVHAGELQRLLQEWLPELDSIPTAQGRHF